MANDLQTEQPREDKVHRDEREFLEKLIGEQVLHALGKPADLRNVQVRKLWNGHYRVNVLVGANAASVTVAKSYFVVIDGDGKFVATTPKLMKQY